LKRKKTNAPKSKRHKPTKSVTSGRNSLPLKSKFKKRPNNTLIKSTKLSTTKLMSKSNPTCKSPRTNLPRLKKKPPSYPRSSKPKSLKKSMLEKTQLNVLLQSRTKLTFTTYMLKELS
jgi:hypothetical protein